MGSNESSGMTFPLGKVLPGFAGFRPFLSRSGKFGSGWSFCPVRELQNTFMARNGRQVGSGWSFCPVRELQNWHFMARNGRQGAGIGAYGNVLHNVGLFPYVSTHMSGFPYVSLHNVGLFPYVSTHMWSFPYVFKPSHLAREGFLLPVGPLGPILPCGPFGPYLGHVVLFPICRGFNMGFIAYVVFFPYVRGS